MTVYDYIMEKLPGRLHMTLLDPEKQSPEEAGFIASEVVRAGSDAIMIGGSTGLNQENVYATIDAIKKKVDVPVIIFPTDINTISLNADAIYFMSLLNSSSLKFLIREQAASSLLLKKAGLESISMGYIVVAPGGKVGEVGMADLVERNDLEGACGYAVAGELLGMRLIYLEAGSGAKEPVPTEMVSAVKDSLKVPLIVGGGIRTPEAAAERVAAGANIIVTGTVVEESKDIFETIKPIVDATKR